MDTPLRGQSLDLTWSTVIQIDPDDTPMFQHRSFQTYSLVKRSSPNTGISDNVTLRKFSGFSSENGINFLLEFESFCSYQNLYSDGRKVFHLHLSGPALIWFNALELENKLTLFALKGAFTAQYAKHGMLNPDLVA